METNYNCSFGRSWHIVDQDVFLLGRAIRYWETRNGFLFPLSVYYRNTSWNRTFLIPDPTLLIMVLFPLYWVAMNYDVDTAHSLFLTLYSLSLTPYKEAEVRATTHSRLDLSTEQIKEPWTGQNGMVWECDLKNLCTKLLLNLICYFLF